MTQLESSKYLLNEVSPEDISFIYEGLSNPDVIKYYGVSFHTLEATKEQMEWYANLRNNNTGIWWGIWCRSTKSFLGAIGLNDCDEKNRKAEIGCWLLPQYWGRGVMQEALPIVCDYGFNKMKCHRIEAFVHSENINCKRFFNKSGFVYEGTMRDCEFEKGRFISLDIYAMLNQI